MTAQDHLVQLAQGGPGGGPTELMRLCLFDWAACAIAGRHEDVVGSLQLDLVGNGACATFGGDAFDPATAALINGTMGHALDYDDTHFDHIGHTSAVIMPAVLAVAQDNLSAMGDILEAALVGSEAALRVGVWLGRDHYQVGYHQTATAGAFGACIALCRLLRLQRPVIRHAIGLTATMASGLKGQFGTMGKPLNAGLAARAAVEAVTWARAGMTSDPQGLQNFATTHHGICDDTAWDTAEPWKIARISHKFHACCHGLHAMLEALRDVPVAPENIERVTIHSHPRWLSVCNQPSPDTGLGVKFSFAHTAAMALYDVDTGKIDVFSDATARDGTLVALREKVAVVADATLSEMEARVIVDGQSFHHDLNRPLAMDVRAARLRVKADGLLGAKRAATLWAALSSDNAFALFD